MTPTTKNKDGSQVDKTTEKDSSSSDLGYLAKSQGLELLIEAIKECSSETREEVADKFNQVIDRKQKERGNRGEN